MYVTKAEAKKLVGRQITYIKIGSRNGWKGHIHSIEADRVNVLYDNGIHQDYSLTALCLDEQGTGYVSHETSQYLLVSQEDVTASRKTLGQDSIVIIEMQTGRIVGHELDFDEAELFAQEQAQDSKDNYTYSVFTIASSYAVKRPRATKL